MGRHRLMNHIKAQQDYKQKQLDKFKEEKLKSSNYFLDTTLIDEEMLEKSQYDYNMFLDINALL